MRGDWDDVEAAVLVGVGAVEMAVVTSTEPEPGTRVFELRSVRDEPAMLRARRLDAGSPTVGAVGPIRIELVASIGRFGDPLRERALIRAIKTRLERLAGVDYAPR